MSIPHINNTSTYPNNQNTAKPNLKRKFGTTNCNIPSYKFNVDLDGFRIPLTPTEVTGYLKEISEKRMKLKVVENLNIKQAEYENSSKPIKPIDDHSPQEVELVWLMLKDSLDRALEIPDPQKKAAAERKFAKLRVKIPT